MRVWTGLASLVLASTVTWAADGWTTYNPKPGPGNLISIEGTSTVHDWRTEGKIIGGKFEAGPGFSTDPATAKPGKVEAKAQVFLPVRSLKSVKDGKPYSNSMDDVMYEKLNEKSEKLIRFELVEMVLKEAPKSASDPFLFDTKGKLTVAGNTKEIAMPVKMKADGKRLEFSGEIAAKMTDFGIEPVSALGGTIKTGDDIKLGMSWVVQGK
ncbi:MAG: hypothetical protein RI897_393 [Verrucomicrobiota bacterium]|jgi:hypothetical protein